MGGHSIALGRALPVADTAQRPNVQIHQSQRKTLDRLPKHIDIDSLHSKLAECHSGQFVANVMLYGRVQIAKSV